MRATLRHLLLVPLLLLPFEGCKKKSRGGSDSSTSQNQQEDPNQDFAPGSLESGECIESSAR